MKLKLLVVTLMVSLASASKGTTIAPMLMGIFYTRGAEDMTVNVAPAGAFAAGSSGETIFPTSGTIVEINRPLPLDVRVAYPTRLIQPVRCFQK